MTEKYVNGYETLGNNCLIQGDINNGSTEIPIETSNVDNRDKNEKPQDPVEPFESPSQRSKNSELHLNANGGHKKITCATKSAKPTEGVANGDRKKNA